MKQHEFLAVIDSAINKFLEMQGVAFRVNAEVFAKNLSHDGVSLSAFDVTLDPKNSGTLYVQATGWRNKKKVNKKWTLTVKGNTINNSLFLRCPNKKPLREKKTIRTTNDILW